MNSESAHLHIFQAVLERAVRLLTLSKLDEIPADWQPRRVKDVQEAAILAFHAEALQPVAAHCLQHSKAFSTPSYTQQCSCPLYKALIAKACTNNLGCAQVPLQPCCTMSRSDEDVLDEVKHATEVTGMVQKLACL